jgi:hypothetical protein
LLKNWYKSDYNRFENLGGEWHTHGVLVSPEAVRVFLDRKEVARFPTLPEFTRGMYPIVSLSLYEKDVAKAVAPITMEVDYVRVYQLAVPGPPEDLRIDGVVVK